MRWAALLGVSERTARAWKARALTPYRRPVGRPAHSGELHLVVARAVAKERRRQGEKVGLLPIAAALSEQPVRVIRAELTASKERFRRAGRRMMAARRVSVGVAGRDVLWSLDATHLGREANGEEVQAQAVREVASTRTLSVSVGPAATTADAIGVMERAAETRGGRFPLVLATDNGSPYTSERFERFLEGHGVLHLRNLPHTPRHNPWVERGHLDIKDETGLGKGAHIESLDDVVRQVVGALARIDGERLRRCLGYRTAWAADTQMEVPYNECVRARLADDVRRRIDDGLHDQLTSRARRALCREAILAALQEMGLITRTRGGRPYAGVKRERDS